MSIKYKNIIAVLLLITLVFTPFLRLTQVQAAGIIPLKELEEVERLLYGSLPDGSILERVTNVENTVYNAKQSGSIVERTEKIVSDVLRSSENDPSLLFLFNTVEWSITGELGQGNLVERINNLEEKVIGENNEGSLKDRIKKLYTISIKGAEMPVNKVKSEKNQLIRVELLESITSKTASRGEKIAYKVLEDVMVDYTLIIPKGAKGELEVTEIEEAGKMGRDGDLKIGFPKLQTIDGTPIRVAIREEAQEENESQKLAIGASILGTALLGLPGVVAGFFVEGKEKEIPAGSNLYIQITESKELNGILIE